MVDKNKALVCCLIATSAIMLSEKKKRKRKMWSSVRTHIRNRALFTTQHNTTRHAVTIPNWNSVINVTFNSVTLARTIWLPDDGSRTETCRSVLNVLMCKFYKCIYVQWLV